MFIIVCHFLSYFQAFLSLSKNFLEKFSKKVLTSVIPYCNICSTDRSSPTTKGEQHMEITSRADIEKLTTLGTKEMRKCFDEKMHECTVTDYLVKLYGDTYHNRSLMHELGFRWWGRGEKYWCKNIETYEELEHVLEAIKDKTIRLYAEPIFRITDNDVNPIEY
jgi:hypothetical protein